MNTGQKLALLLCPLLLRWVLGVTFTFASVGYLFGEVAIKGQDAATLASMGVALAPTSGPGGELPISSPANGAASPGKKSPLRERDGASPAKPRPAAGSMSIAQQPTAEVPDQMQRTAPEALSAVEQGKQTAPQPPGPATAIAVPPPLFTAAQFALPVTVRKVNLTAIKIAHAAFPPKGSKSEFSLFPQLLASGMWPVYMAYSVAILQLLASILLLLGVYCRFWALLLATFMLGALFIDQLAPALRAGTTVLLIVPGPGPDQQWHDLDAYRPLLLQLALLAMSICVALLGSGAIALDNAQAKAGPKRKHKPAAAETDDDE